MVQESATLGIRLRRRREELGLSREELASKISAPRKFIEALEEEKYDTFPAKVYALGFFKKILAVLQIPNQESWVEEFSKGWEGRTFQKKLLWVAGNSKPTFYYTSANLRLVGGLLFFLLILWAVAMELVNFSGAPPLLIEEPKEQAVLSLPLARVRGRVKKESRLTINGREITIDEAGNFDEKMELAAGLNILEFKVEDKLGKISKETRYLLVK